MNGADHAGGAATTADTACDCKVGRVADRYGLDDLDRELRTRWIGEGHEKHSLRKLEGYLGRRVLESALFDAGVDTLQGEVENLYDLLSGEDTSEGVRVEARKRLERDGVDVDRVEGDFVSHQSIHTHLRECLDVNHDPGEGATVERGSSTVYALRNRTETVTAGTLERLRDNGKLALDGFDVYVDVRVACEECGRFHEIGTLFEAGGCDCQRG
ncbi:rod-determining factor RdfA [Halobium palmae]|uniref:Rod-determining factor RdfA n=1 Tax=Halobium palmae TaxID=1776492 RepID=A0ABD5RXZ2_9EURY